MPALETKATGLVLLWQTKSVRHKGNEVRPKVGPRQTLDRPTWQRINARQWTRKTVIPCAWQVKGESMPALETKAINLALLGQTRSVVRLQRSETTLPPLPVGEAAESEILASRLKLTRGARLRQGQLLYYYFMI